jgi:hypothetical protein
MVVERRGVETRVREELEAAALDGNLYAIVDAARVPGLRVLLRELHVEHEPLATGRNGEDLSSVVPYLVRFSLSEETLLWFGLQQEAAAAALFAVTDESFAPLRRHLKRFLRIEATDGRSLYFRFYDPRILGPFLSACSPQESATFFGPVRYYLGRDPQDDDVSERPALLRWSPAFDGRPEAARYPTARRRFRLRPEHEQALAADAMARYEKRAVAYLRGRCAARTARMADEELVQVVRRARQFGGDVGMEAGQDVTMLAEALLQDAEDQVHARVVPLAPALRRAELILLCEELQP